MIRAYVKKYVLPKHLDVDEEDAVTLLTLLAQTGMLNPSRLSENQPKSTFAKPRRFDLKEAAYFDCEGPSRCNNRKRITYVRLGNWDTPVWNFHTEQVFQLLSRLECLETLCLDRCQSFRLTETIGRSVLSDVRKHHWPLEYRLIEYPATYASSESSRSTHVEWLDNGERGQSGDFSL